MEVEVRLFGNVGQYLRQARNRASFTKSVGPDTTVQEILKEFELPERMAVVVAVNGRQSGPDRILRDGDVITVFRPTGGG
jgi:sulfur carrier protein ThiS